MTVDVLATKILADIVMSEWLGVPRKYPLPPNGPTLDMMLPNDKPLCDCTGKEVMMIGQAYNKVGEMLGAAGVPESHGHKSDRYEKLRLGDTKGQRRYRYVGL